MQELQTIETEGTAATALGILQTNRGLSALLALGGSRQLGIEEMKRRTRLSTQDLKSILTWLQREGLVYITSKSDGQEMTTTVALTGSGERELLRVLEQTFELPETY